MNGWSNSFWIPFVVVFRSAFDYSGEQTTTNRTNLSQSSTQGRRSGTVKSRRSGMSNPHNPLLSRKAWEDFLFRTPCVKSGNSKRTWIFPPVNRSYFFTHFQAICGDLASGPSWLLTKCGFTVSALNISWSKSLLSIINVLYLRREH